MSIDKGTLGNKLERCRKNLKLEISDIEKNIGMSMERIEAIEKGIIEPTGDEILIFADFYKQDYKYFISNDKLSASEQIEILYRKHGENFSKEDRWAIQEFIFLCEAEQDILQYLQFTGKQFELPTYKNIYKSQGIDAADKLRSFLGYKGKELYSDLYSEFRKIGIHIFRRKLSNSNISGLYIKHPVAGKCVLINYDDDIYRQNFTLTHEICHALLDDNIGFNVSFEGETGFREIRANAFASSFLIPASILNNFNNTRWSNDLILKVANQLKVNVQPLLIALKSNSYINQNEYNTFINLKIPRSHKVDYELQDLSNKIISSKKVILEKGLSSYYVRNCHEAYIRGDISSGKLAEILLVDVYELPVVLELFKLKLNYGY